MLTVDRIVARVPAPTEPPVSATTPALVAAAAGVGLGHAILPDHWVPLGVFSRTNRYPLARVARLAGLAGVAHVLVSLVIGAVIVVVGLQLRSTVEHIQNAIVGGLLVATGLGFALLEASQDTGTRTPTTTTTTSTSTTTTTTSTSTTTTTPGVAAERSWSRSAPPPRLT